MSNENILIGRKEEQQILDQFYHSGKAEFIAIYGRRRIGKTYLVRNFFKNKDIFMEFSGSYNSSDQTQIKNFYSVFTAFFTIKKNISIPSNWQEAFDQLIKALKTINSNRKVVLFFDELPWLADGSSDFLPSFEYMWNRYLSQMNNIKLIVCGSAASWMLENIINNKGGLHNRISRYLRLLPFDLIETKKYLYSKNINFSDKDICEIFMITGGVPLYLSYIQEGMSVSQNIEQLCFKTYSPLLTEFSRLYTSLFNNALTHLKIIEVLAKHKRGMPRAELLEQAGFRQKSGYYTKALEELEESGFIFAFKQIYKKTRDRKYILTDQYTLFYFKWIETVKQDIINDLEEDYWIKKQGSQSWESWSGYSFETICLMHLKRIKMALQIGSVSTQTGYWKYDEQGKKMIEVDLVIDRADNCINLCEIKFCKGEFVITPEYVKKLQEKKDFFIKKTKTKKNIFITLITPYGCRENFNYHAVANNQISLKDLFY